METLHFGADSKNLLEMLEIIRLLYRRGELPATAGNFSLRSEEKAGCFLVTQSGVDKGKLGLQNFIRINGAGEMDPTFASSGKKTSDETDLHLMIYKNGQARAIIHTHDPKAVALSLKEKKVFEFSDLEILKGISGIKTHQTKLKLVIFENSQDIRKLADEVQSSFKEVETAHAFFLRGHGLYTWGNSVHEAKRHYEVYNYLFELMWLNK